MLIDDVSQCCVLINLFEIMYFSDVLNLRVKHVFYSNLLEYLMSTEFQVCNWLLICLKFEYKLALKVNALYNLKTW